MKTCLRCNKVWWPRSDTPKLCGKCRSAWWDVPLTEAGRLRREKRRETMKRKAAPTPPIFASQAEKDKVAARNWAAAVASGEVEVDADQWKFLSEVELAALAAVGVTEPATPSPAPTAEPPNDPPTPQGDEPLGDEPDLGLDIFGNPATFTNPPPATKSRFKEFLEAVQAGAHISAGEYDALNEEQQDEIDSAADELGNTAVAGGMEDAGEEEVAEDDKPL